MMSLWLLFAGHNQPGGGFVGGLLAGSAITLRYIAGGIDEVRGRSRFRPWTVLGAACCSRSGPPPSRSSPAAPCSRSASRRSTSRSSARSRSARRSPSTRRLPRGRRHGAHGLRGLRRRPRGGDAVTVMLAATAAALFGIGTYLLLQRKLSRIIIGLGLLTHGANVLLITAGRRGDPPLVGDGTTADVRRPAAAGARADRHRDHLRGHHAPARAGLPQLAADPRRRGAGRRRRPGRRPRRRRRTTRSPTSSRSSLERRRRDAGSCRSRSCCRSSAPRCRSWSAARGPRSASSAMARPRRARRRLGRAARRGRRATARSSPRPADGRRRWASRSSPTGSPRVLLVVAEVMLFAVLVYAIGEPGAERNHVGFQSAYLVLAAGVAASFLTGDLFNLFVVVRDDADRELRAAHARRTTRAGPLGHDLRRHQPHRVDAVRHRAGAAVLRDRHGQHGRPRTSASATCPPGCGRRSPSCCSSCSASRRRCSRCSSGCPTATRPRRHRSPPCSPGC